MKKHFKLIAIIIAATATAFQSQSVQAQTNASQKDTTRKYFSRLANSENPQDKMLLESKLYQLLKSAKESDWFTARRFFFELKKPATADSVLKAQQLKFPQGMAVRDTAVMVIYDEKDAVKKEANYKAWVKKYPPQKFGEERIDYDYARNAVATAYAKDGNVKKALLYANMVETPVWKGEGWASPAGQLVKTGYLTEAAELYKKASANSYKYMTTNRSDDGAGFAAQGYVSYNNSLAEILLKQKKYAEALKYVREAHDSSKNVRSYINSNYAAILMALGKNQEAFDKINEAVKEGQATQQMKDNLKTLYAKVKGGNEGYDEYMISLNKILADKMKAAVAKQMVNLPAPDFTLSDVDGKPVSLSALKGKTVVLDFWATWCGPCKKSFPAMKLAVTKYKDDPNVKFLFIHTWEHGVAGATQNAKKYVDDNAYPFEVLMDLQETGTGINKVVESYKVAGIPAKFIIDKNGNIRFKLTGFEGGDDAAVEEISAMIELAQKSS